MTERRKNRRLINDDTAVVTWQNGAGCSKQLGTVEEMSEKGLSLGVGKALPVMTSITVSYGGNQQSGIVRHSEPRGFGYLLRIELQDDSQNSAAQFRPAGSVGQHETFWEERS